MRVDPLLRLPPELGAGLEDAGADEGDDGEAAGDEPLPRGVLAGVLEYPEAGALEFPLLRPEPLFLVLPSGLRLPAPDGVEVPLGALDRTDGAEPRTVLPDVVPAPLVLRLAGALLLRDAGATVVVAWLPVRRLAGGTLTELLLALAAPP